MEKICAYITGNYKYIVNTCVIITLLIKTHIIIINKTHKKVATIELILVYYTTESTQS